MGIFSNIFQRKPQLEPVRIGDLKVDMHSHLLPGIDDGAKTMDHTIGMIRKFHELGYQKLIMTPHVMWGAYNNTTEGIRQKLNEVRATIQALGIQIELDASAEFYFDETLFERIKTRDLLPFSGNHILFEFSFRNEPQQVEQLIFDLIGANYKPVLAHFERYYYFHNQPNKAKELRDRGCLIQVNLLSFTGHYGPEVKKMALQLLKNKEIDLLGSDCHRIEHLLLLEEHLSSPVFHELMELTSIQNTNLH